MAKFFENLDRGEVCFIHSFKLLALIDCYTGEATGYGVGALS